MSINKISRHDVNEFARHLEFLKNTSEQGSTLDEYQRIAGQSAIYPGSGTPLGLINLEKLCDRGERDKLQGSGDER